MLMRISLIFTLVLGTAIQSGCGDSNSGTDGIQDGRRDLGYRPSIKIDQGLLPEPDTLPDLTRDMASGQSIDAGPMTDSAVTCVPDELIGCEDPNTLRLCNGDGSGFITRPCPQGQRCTAGQCEPSACAAGFRICLDDSTVGECARDESGYIPVRACRADSVCVDGACDSACNVQGKVPSNVGCEYWSVDLDNYPDPFSNDPSSVPHAIAISNTSDGVATVTIEGPPGVPLQGPRFDIAPGDISVYTFPRLDIDGTGIFDRAFRVRSTWPVIVYQFNPLNNEGVASNDASLLLPAEGLGREYIAMSWPTSPIPCLEGQMMPCLPDQHGYVTIVATAPGNTTIQVTPTATVNAGGEIEQLPEGMPREFVLRQGQVLNLEAYAEPLGNIEDFFPRCETDDDCIIGGCLVGICLGDLAAQAERAVADLTGTIIVSSQPVAVFGGHEEAVVGEGCCAEHLEQQLFPTSTWGQRYLAARSEPRGGSIEVWRVVASTDNTVVTTVPPQPDSGQFTLNRGEFHEITSQDAFEIEASAPIMVGQYLASQEATGDRVGDPAFILAPPIAQFRSDYQIITPAGYSRNWLTVARMVGEEVTLDGAVLEDRLFQVFGGGDYELAWIPVGEGVHHLACAQPFALSVYGYSAAVSYGYPGGLNLRSEANP
jgi:hypothetical protein